MGAEGEAYVAGVVRLGHDLDLTVVAEGIEDHETLVALQELGCDVGQGFLFAKPLPAAELEAWLDAVIRRNGRPSARSWRCRPTRSTSMRLGA